MNARRAAWDIRLKYEVFCNYSGVSEIWPPTSKSIPFCACCRETNFGLLTLDHIFGKKDQSYSGIKYQGGTTLYRELRQLGYPKGFRVLCHNCNHAYGHYGVCPHLGEIELTGKHWGVKFKALEILGNQCQCCHESEPIFLSVDHREGGGKKYRKLGGHIERDIVHGKVDTSGLQVLCMNCNCGRGLGKCPHEISNWPKEILRVASVPGKGQPTGERQPSSKLTVAKVREIKELRKTKGLSGRKLGYIFGVSDTIIYKILNNELWQIAA
jgi:hypothetical protein